MTKVLVKSKLEATADDKSIAALMIADPKRRKNIFWREAIPKLPKYYHFFQQCLKLLPQCNKTSKIVTIKRVKTRDGTEYSNIRKSAKYSNSKIIFYFSIYGEKISYD